MAVGDIYEAVLEGTTNGQNWAMVLHYEVTDEPVPPLLYVAAQTVSEAARDSFTGILFFLSDQCSLTLSRANRVYPSLGVPWVELINPVVPGGATGDAMPGKDAMVVKLQCNGGGRSLRGRKYFPGIPESAQVDGCLTQDFLDDVNTLIESWFLTPITDGDGNEYTPVVFSRKLLSGNPIVLVTPDPVVRSMGTRQPRFALPA